jgi:putative tryptophan/tyrosine transport system substrate-binding protein
VGTADAEKINRFARELVASQPDVILSSTTLSTKALLQRTSTIPIVFATVADPVGSGFVTTLARPGGNTTGFTNVEGSMAGKWLELLKQIAPGVDRVALLFNPATTPYAEIYLSPFKEAATALGVKAITMPVGDTHELETAVATFASVPNGGLMVIPGPFTANRSRQITALTAGHRLPAVFPFSYYVERGGLVSYGNDQYDNYRRAAGYLDRILRGDNAGEIPVQSPVKFELTINLKAARALGLTVPPSLLAQTDKLIE